MTPPAGGRGARDWRGRSVTVMGLGLFGGGAGVARWLAEQGARVTVTDLRHLDVLRPSVERLADLDLRFVLGRHDEQDFVHAACVVANAAVPPGNPLLQRARAAGAEVTTELELFLDACTVPQIWVSGTQGKSSTAHMLTQLLERAGRRARLAGNIGRSLVAELGGGGSEAPGADRIVVEVSSYQLEHLPDPLPGGRTGSRVEGVVLTNVLADHLERHGSVEAYVEAKARLLSVVAPGGFAILPGGDARLRRRAPADCRVVEHGTGPGWELGLRGDRFVFGTEDLGPVARLSLPGTFQIANALPALGAARLDGVSAPDLEQSLTQLRGLPHRLEDLGLVRGRRVIDNGVSTTPDSTLSALDSIDGTCTLLLGGRTKRGLGFEELAERAASRGCRAVTFGHGRQEIGDAFTHAGVETTRVESMEEAARCALDRTPEGEVLLFSPAAASFDAFANFRQRALAFRRTLGLPPESPGADPAESEGARSKAEHDVPRR